MDRTFYLPEETTGTATPDRPERVDTVVQRLPQTLSYYRPAQFEGVTAGRLVFHLFLLGLTVLTTWGVGTLWLYDDQRPLSHSILNGFIYSFSIIIILGAHEMGHYIACRWYGVNATPPYFLPVPLPPVGTFGAFIRIKSPIPTRRALFDIGIAGPLAGFVFVIPAAIIAHYFSEPAPPPAPGAEMIYFHDPLLFKFLHYVFNLPPEINMNPILWAAWVGAFMTSLNLLPVGQLDGGHVTFAVFGPRGHRMIALASYLSVIGLAVYSVIDGMWNWVVYAVILTLLIRVGHPPVVDDREPLGSRRILVALIGLLVFILSFMPVPFSF